MWGMWERVRILGWACCASAAVLGCQADPGELTAEAEPIPVMHTAGLSDAAIPGCVEVWDGPALSSQQPLDCTLTTTRQLRCDRITEATRCDTAPAGWFYGDCAEMPGNTACQPYPVPQCGGVGLWVSGCRWTGSACILRSVNEATQGCAAP